MTASDKDREHEESKNIWIMGNHQVGDYPKKTAVVQTNLSR
ncbi:hypothetical protein [Methylotuvimicrobium sp. KM1]